MDRQERERHLKSFVDKWGIDVQSLMCIEEMSELTKELCKYSRLKNRHDDDIEQKRKDNIEHIKEEIADVSNMIEQMKMYFGAEDIDRISEEKINRTVMRMNKGC